MSKRVLNTHISEAEHAHLKALAREQDDTLTNVVRGLIRGSMREAEADSRVTEQLDSWLEKNRNEVLATTRLTLRNAKLKESHE